MTNHQTWQSRRRVLIHAILHFTVNYHSGQWSRGYRLQCRAMHAARRYGMHHPLDYGMVGQARRIYDRLVDTYGQHV